MVGCGNGHDWVQQPGHNRCSAAPTKMNKGLRDEAVGAIR